MKAFSLVELMVVIAIIAILSSVAMTSYRQYKIKAQIVLSFQIAQKLVNDVKREYEITGTFPSSLKVGGLSIGSWTTVNLGGNIYSLFYSSSGDGLGVRIGVNLSGLDGIPGYINPTTATPAGNSAYTIGIRDENNVIKIVCGQNDPVYAYQQIPLIYLPSNCQCISVNRYTISGIEC